MLKTSGCQFKSQLAWWEFRDYHLLNKILCLFQLADSLVPLEIKPGISLATVSAVLHTKDNKHVLQVWFDGDWRKLHTQGSPGIWVPALPMWQPLQLAPMPTLQQM